MGHSHAYLDLLETSEREIMRRSSETHDELERFECAVELDNVAIMRENFINGFVI
jgi:hypothetical protein